MTKPEGISESAWKAANDADIQCQKENCKEENCKEENCNGFLCAKALRAAIQDAVLQAKLEEREACAKLVDAMHLTHDPEGLDGYKHGLSQAIRNRGEQ